MKKRQIKKLNKKAMELLISCGWSHPDDFELWANDWFMYVQFETREECWSDQVEPFAYLAKLVEDTLVEYVEVDDDSEVGFHIEEVWADDSYLSVIKVFSIFRQTYGGKKV